LQANIAGNARDDGDVARQAIEVLNKRVDQFGVAQPVASANPVDLSGSALEGRIPDSTTFESIPQAGGDKIVAGTLVQDGRLLYEAGKFKEAEDKLNQALKVDPNNQGANYYLSLDKQADYAREEQNRTSQGQDSMVQVSKAWSPKVGVGLPAPIPNASTAPPTPTETTVAWNTFTLDQSRTGNQGGDSWQGGALLGPVPNSGDASQSRSAGGTVHFRTQAGETGQDKTPVMGDVPLVGRWFAGSAMAPAVVPAPSSTPVSTIKGFLDDNFTTGNGPKNMGEDNKRLLRSGNGTLELTDGNLYSSINGVVANNGTLTTSGGKLTLGGNNSFADGVVANNGTLAYESSDQTLGNGLRYDLNGVAGQASISVDPNAHKLVIVADQPTEEQIRGVINSLDSPANKPRQLFIQATNAFVANDGTFNNGLTRDDVSGARFRPQSTAPLFLWNSSEEPPTLEMRAFKVNPNTFSNGLQNVSTVSFGGTSGRGGNAGTGVVGLAYMNPSPTTQGDVTSEADHFFKAIGVNLAGSNAPGRSIAFNDRLGTLFVRATPGELDTVERVVQSLNQGASDQQLSSGLHGTMVTGTTTPNPSEIITQIVPVRFVDVREMVAKLASSVSPQATIVANDAGNSIVITDTRQNLKRLTQLIDSLDVPPRPAVTNAPIPQPEILTRENAFSTFSMNVSDVSFKLAQASLQKGQMPDPASIRSEEFINAFNYRDPEAAAGQPLAFASERARYPFAHNRDLLRFSVKTAAAGRQAGRWLNLVLLLDTSGSMERADRVTIIREALRVLASQLQPQDTVSVVTFSRTARLWADGVSGDKAGATLDQVGGITPDGGTNLEEAMRLAYETARRHYLANGMNRVVLLTDGAANLGNVDPGALKQKVEAQRRQGIALDCFGIGWEDFNDDLLEQLSGNGDGRYAFINSPDEAGTEFAAKLAGALQVAAQDVKVQVEFNPQRVISWRQIGYAKHQLTKEQFRDNTVLAAEIAAQEAGNALYTVETKPDGTGPIATVYVRYRIPGTQDVRERSWTVDGDGTVPALDQSSAAMRLAATASAFSEWLAASPFAQEVTPDELLKDLSGVPQIYGADQCPQQMEWMIRQAKSLVGQAIPSSQPRQTGGAGQPGGF
jgi:Mg-chelatase subunit ChlD